MPEVNLSTVLNEAFRRLNEASRRLRASEERYDVLETRLEGLQNTMLKISDELSVKIEKNSGEQKDFEARLIRIEADITKIGQAAEKSAKASDLEELKELVSLYSPFKEKRKSD